MSCQVNVTDFCNVIIDDVFNACCYVARKATASTVTYFTHPEIHGVCDPFGVELEHTVLIADER